MISKQFFKLWFFRLKYLSHKVTLKRGCNIAINSIFLGCNVVGKNGVFAGRLGYGTYIGENSIITGLVGNYCSIATGVKVLGGTHPLENFVSTSPVFYSLLKQNNVTYVTKQFFKEFLYADNNDQYPVIIGNDVWIGTNVIINGGLVIGNGAVILSGAVISKDVPPYAIVGGVPSKVLRYRFDEETIKFLLDLQWWNQSPKWLRKNAMLFHNIDQFKKEFKNE